ncbi:isocitrate/isopropylmalate family dehydrogenase [Kiritimatiellota bacterium B12222]|nr:isocitrate/isopropylmalate family dehydrogenase [Kiritimatiellota bacterium B12222]
MSQHYHIGVFPGDGQGPSVIQAAQQVLKAVSKRYGFKIKFKEYPYSGAHYLETGELCPDKVVEELQEHPAILFGGVGHPEVTPGLLSREILLKIADSLDLYISERPVRLMPGVKSYLRTKTAGQIDYVIIREHSGGLNGKMGGRVLKGTSAEIAQENLIYTRYQVDRCLRYAFQVAQSPNRKGKLTLTCKSSLQPHVYDLWARAFKEMGETDFPQIQRSYMEVDDICMQLVRNPESFDVIVTGNLTGDILANVGAVSQGGAGYAAIGSLHPGKTGMFGPMRASPEFYEVTDLQANPISAIGAAVMMLRYLGQPEAAHKIEEAMIVTLATEVMGEGTILSRFQTKEVADIITQRLLR